MRRSRYEPGPGRGTAHAVVRFANGERDCWRVRPLHPSVFGMALETTLALDIVARLAGDEQPKQRFLRSRRPTATTCEQQSPTLRK